MKPVKLFSNFSVLLVVLTIFVFEDHNLSYVNCMEQTKSVYITEKGATHVSAQCKAFIKDKLMVK